jgi:MarR family transcriptional regulator, organic hydroperoxide resistance regulator
MTDEAKQELINKILEYQRQMGRQIKAEMPNAWLELNLTMAQLKTLIFIYFEGVTNFKMIAAALGVTPPNVTGIIDRLVEQGLVTREENPQNRRMQMLSLTITGKALLSDLKERQTTHLSRILTILSIEELSILIRGMEILVNAAANINQKQARMKMKE